MAAENLYRNTVVPQGQHNAAVNQEVSSDIKDHKVQKNTQNMYSIYNNM